MVDPKGLPIADVRPIRDDIRRRVEDLLHELRVRLATWTDGDDSPDGRGDVPR